MLRLQRRAVDHTARRSSKRATVIDCHLPIELLPDKALALLVLL
jgi:hypothetical protein